MSYMVHIFVAVVLVFVVAAVIAGILKPILGGTRKSRLYAGLVPAGPIAAFLVSLTEESTTSFLVYLPTYLPAAMFVFVLILIFGKNE